MEVEEFSRLLEKLQDVEARNTYGKDFKMARFRA